jgi:hypothetical protein
VGVPAARGHGVMEVQKLEAPFQDPESTVIVSAAFGMVDRPMGSNRPGTFVPKKRFAAYSPFAQRNNRLREPSAPFLGNTSDKSFVISRKLDTHFARL